MRQDTKNLLAQIAESPSLTEEDALALQQKLIAEHGLAGGEEADKINAAARLLMTGKHREAIVAYTAIMDEHPEKAGTCEGQIGAAYFFLEDYEKAIAYYEAAKEHGEDAGMMDDNIQEAKEARDKAAQGGSSEAEGGGKNPLVLIGLLAIIVVALYFVFR